MKYLIDAQLPPVLAQVLRKNGYEVLAVREVGLREAKDQKIWEYALNSDATIITKDEDFAELSILKHPFPPIVWLRVGNTSNRELLKWLLPLWPIIVQRINAGEKLIEIWRDCSR